MSAPLRREETLAPVVRVGWGLLYTCLCVRDGVSDEEAALEATLQDPPGTSLNQWVVTDPESLDKDSPIRESIKRCPDYPNRRHMVVNC